MKLDRDALSALITTSDDAFTVDLSAALGIKTPVRVGLDDVSSLLESGHPTFHFEVDQNTVTVKTAEGGWLVEWMTRF